MKKFTIIGLAICLAFALAAPVMATDVDFSGRYYVRGSYVSHWNLDDRSASNAYMDMSFRLQTVFKVNDILSVTTRFDALDDKVWGDTDDTAAANIDFDRAYMTIKAPIGTFVVGRQKASAFGTSFLDYEEDLDRIKYVKKIDNLKVMAIFQKNAEGDKATGVGDEADKDSETYYLIGIYKMENTTLGLLGGFANDKNTVANATKRTYVALPYFVSKFGPLAIQGELRYNWGEIAYDTTAQALAAGGSGTTTDIDLKQLAYNLEATYNVGPASIMAGYAFVSGDNDAKADDESSNHTYGVGNDWGKLFILTTSDVGVLATTLGGYGNLSMDGDCTYGAKIIYGGATFSPLDNLELGVVVGKADADEIPAANSKDDYGLEYDFTLNWEIYDNLTYSAVVAFLRAGDFYKEQSAIPEANFDDTYALFHQLELSF
jgi:hypothetical protein